MNTAAEDSKPWERWLAEHQPNQPHILMVVGKGWSAHDHYGIGINAMAVACPPGSAIKIIHSPVDAGACEMAATKTGLRFITLDGWDSTILYDTYDMLVVLHPYIDNSVRCRHTVIAFNQLNKPVMMARDVQECQTWRFQKQRERGNFDKI